MNIKSETECKTGVKSETMKNTPKESRSWLEQAEPILSGLMSGWRLIPVDMKSNEVNRILNMECGIDYLLYSDDEVYGLAV